MKMNKRELIKHINNTLFDNLKDTLFAEPTLSITESAKDNKVTIAFETEQGGLLVGGMLKKFEKVTIPQFVADWYEENKDDFETNLFQLIESLEVAPCEEDDLIDFISWLIDKDTKPFQTLVNMHQFGYTIEKEKRYLVKIKGNIKENTLVYGELLERYFFTKGFTLGNAIYHHTHKELEEADFGWVFDCEGIEIEEVE